MAERKVTYNGEELTYYDATQKQREIERAIRKAKREAGALEAAGLDNTAERVKLGQYQAKMRDFLDQTGLVRDRFRESVPGMNVRGLNPTEPKDQAATSRAKMSAAFTYGKKNVKISEALSAIDEVHDGGNLPVIPIEEVTNLGAGVEGAFQRTVNGKPVKIQVLKTAQNKLMTVTHEIGHYIDLTAINPAGHMAESKINGALSEWWKAVENSDAFKKWKEIKQNGGLVDANGNIIEKVGDNYIEYSMRQRELWARSYAQFIATESSNGAMKAELADELTYRFPNQWDDVDFAPIGKAIYNLFKVMGWMI